LFERVAAVRNVRSGELDLFGDVVEDLDEIAQVFGRVANVPNFKILKFKHFND
jgi:hypothetical protein